MTRNNFIWIVGLVLLTSTTSSFAGDISDSNLSEVAALSIIGPPLLLSLGVVALPALAVEELSEEMIYSLSKSETPCTVNCVTVGKKSIPFVVREDYVQFNQKVGP